jgi:hypothetical protein
MSHDMEVGFIVGSSLQYDRNLRNPSVTGKMLAWLFSPSVFARSWSSARVTSSRAESAS